MNFNPQLSSGAAIAMSLTAAAMWGTCIISLKYLGDYPLDAFFVTLNATSFIFIWIVGLLIDRGALLGNMGEVWASDPTRILVTYLCGIIYISGMRFSLTVLSTIGLSLAQPIQSAIGSLTSLAIAVVIGGVPAGVPVSRLFFAALILIMAVFVAMLAGRMRAQAQASQSQNGQYVPMSAIWRSLGLVLVSNLLSPAYPFALSYGLRSSSQSHGMAVLPFMAVLVSGAFTGTLLTSAASLTRRRQWQRVWTAGFRIHKFGIWSGLFLYGGNIIHTFAVAFFSAAIAFPLGNTSGLWTQMWGLVYGEFKAAPPKSYLALFLGVVLYIIGGYIIVKTLP